MIELHIARRVEGKIEFLLLKRGKNETYPGLWQMVSGKVNEGEKAYEAALRELFEETTLRPMNFWVAPNINSFYYPETDSVNFLPVFLCEVKPEDEVRISNEHEEYRWVTPDEAFGMVAWEGQRRSISICTEYLMQKESVLNFVKIDVT